MRKETNKGMWKRTLGIFLHSKIPWHLYILEALLGIVSAKTALLCVPYYSKLGTGDIFSEGVLVGYIGFAALGAVIALLAGIPVIYSNPLVRRNLQNRMISKLLRLPVSVYEQEQPSVYITQIGVDVDYVHLTIESIRILIVNLASSMMSFAAMSGIDNYLAFLILPIAGYIILSTLITGKLTFLREKYIRKAISQTTAFFAEHTYSLIGIKQKNGIRAEQEAADKAIDEMYRADVKAAFINVANSILSGSSDTIIAILIFALGASRVRAGNIVIADLVAFRQYIQTAMAVFYVLPNLYSTSILGVGRLFYIGKLLNEPEEKYVCEQGMDLPNQDIVFENITFSYRDRNVFQNMSLTIPKGKITALIGENGSGKTTLFKLLERFYEPQEGHIRFGETDISKIHLNEWRQSFGYVLQNPQLFNGSFRENIAYGLDRVPDDEELIAAAKMACAYDFIMSCPGGFDFNIGDNGSRLSEGEKQRIAFARTIMLDPEYLLLDEVTSNMDVYVRDEVRNAVFNLMKGRTTVFISHDPNMVQRADQVIVLGNGGVEAQGNLEEIERTSKTYQKMMQAAGMMDEDAVQGKQASILYDI